MSQQRWGRLVVATYTRSPHWLRAIAERLVTPGYRVGVLVVVSRPDGHVLLVDQPYVRGWSLPGGNLNRRETVRAGAIRELREELGIELDLSMPVLAHHRSHDRWVTFVTAVDIADHEAEGVAACSPEVRAVAWFDPDLLPEVHADSAVPLALMLGQPSELNQAASRPNPSSSPTIGA